MQDSRARFLNVIDSMMQISVKGRRHAAGTGSDIVADEELGGSCAPLAVGLEVSLEQSSPATAGKKRNRKEQSDG